MAAPIPPMLKYSMVCNLLNFPLILIKFESKFIVCKTLYFKAQYLLMLRSPLNQELLKMMIFSMTGLAKCCITFAYLQCLFHLGEPGIIIVVLLYNFHCTFNIYMYTRRYWTFDSACLVELLILIIMVLLHIFYLHVYPQVFDIRQCHV